MENFLEVYEMNLRLAGLTELYAKEVCDWKYDDIYSIYIIIQDGIKYLMKNGGLQ